MATGTARPGEDKGVPLHVDGPPHLDDVPLQLGGGVSGSGALAYPWPADLG